MVVCASFSFCTRDVIDIISCISNSIIITLQHSPAAKYLSYNSVAAHIIASVDVSIKKNLCQTI